MISESHAMSKRQHLNDNALHCIALHANCSNLRIQDIEEGIARLEMEHPGSEIPVVSSEIFIFAEKGKVHVK